jgi:hypothetical protein
MVIDHHVDAMIESTSISAANTTLALNTYFIDTIFVHKSRLIDPVNIERTELEQEILVYFLGRRSDRGRGHGVRGIVSGGSSLLRSGNERHALKSFFSFVVAWRRVCCPGCVRQLSFLSILRRAKQRAERGVGWVMRKSRGFEGGKEPKARKKMRDDFTLVLNLRNLYSMPILWWRAGHIRVVAQTKDKTTVTITHE